METKATIIEMGNTALNGDSVLRKQFMNVMENAKPLMTEGKGKTMRVLTSTAWIPLDLCYVDERYQGFRTHKQLNKLRSKFDKRKLTPIIVVPHYDEYRFAIADGQGRWLLAPEKGLEGLYAIILMDAPEDPVERLKFEAEYFIGQNTEVEEVKPIEKHLARVIIGDTAATILDDLTKEYDISIANNQGHRGQSVLGSYTETYAICKSHGRKCLEFIFSTIDNAGWNHESNGYSCGIMRALREVWRHYPLDREKINTYLSKKLRNSSPKIFISNAVAKYPNKGDHKISCILYMEDIVCNGLNLPIHYYLDDDTKKIVLKK